MAKLQCKNCGKPRLKYSAAFCSDSCRDIYEARKGQRSNLNHYTSDEISFCRQCCNSIKIDKGCAICGYNKTAQAMDFHHIKGKTANVSQLAGIEMFREIKRCVVLCSRCHRELHAGLHSLKPLHHHIVTTDDIGFMEGDWEERLSVLKAERAVRKARSGFNRFRQGIDRKKVAMKLVAASK